MEALDLPGEGWTAYLNPDTGEIVAISQEERRLVEEDIDPDELPDWQQELLSKVREVLASDCFLRLPDRCEIHEWSIMERFAESRSIERHRDELLDAIHGTGAFRMFRASIRRLGIEDQWYRFRESVLEQIAEDWLDAHDVDYK